MTILNRMFLFCILLLCIPLSGCLEVKGEIVLNEDGSGTLTVSESISSEGMLMLKGLSATGQIPDIDYISHITEVNEEELSEVMNDFTEGLEFQSGKEATFDNGSVGRITTYSFKDIRNIKVFDNNHHDKSVVEVSFTKGKLVIESEINDTDFDEFIHGLEEIERLPEQIRPLFKGMKFSLTVKTPSAITRTNATYLLKDKSGIILFSLDIGKIINSPAAIAALKKFSFEIQETEQQNIEEFAYFQVEPQEKVTVEF